MRDSGSTPSTLRKDKRPKKGQRRSMLDARGVGALSERLECMPPILQGGEAQPGQEPAEGLAVRMLHERLGAHADHPAREATYPLRWASSTNQQLQTVGHSY